MSRYVGKHEKGRATSNRTPRRSGSAPSHSAEPKRESNSSTGSKLIKGATILAVAGIVSKLLGAVFRLPLANLIGAEGMSYYGMAYPVYSFFLVLSTAGLPVAISRMVSERTALGDHRNAYKTYKVSFTLMVSIGAVSFLICFFGAGAIARAMGNPGAKASLMAIAPALLLAPIVSSFRGYFQGRQNMVPTGTSQVAEQLVRVCVGLSLSFILAKESLELASAGATFGASAGLVMALIVLLGIFFFGRNKRRALIESSIERHETKKGLFKELLEIAIPITIGSTIMPLMMIIDSMVIMRRLQATGWSLAEAKTLYGLISGFCDPLIGFPGVFIDAVSMSLLPAVTAAFVLKKREELDRTVQTGIKTMMTVAYPCAIGLIVLARPILHMLYPMRLEEADMAVANLQILSLSILTLSAMRTFSTTLQAVGKMVLPVINLFIGALVKIVISYLLVGIPALNINGAAIGSVAAYLVAGFLNYRAMCKYAETKIDLVGTFIRPLIASGLMGVVTLLTYKVGMMVLGRNSIATLAAIMVAVVVYFFMIFVTKTMNREDALMLPGGRKIVKLSDKLHLTSPGE